MGERKDDMGGCLTKYHQDHFWMVPFSDFFFFYSLIMFVLFHLKKNAHLLFERTINHVQCETDAGVY